MKEECLKRIPNGVNDDKSAFPTSLPFIVYRFEYGVDSFSEGEELPLFEGTLVWIARKPYVLSDYLIETHEAAFSKNCF